MDGEQLVTSQRQATNVLNMSASSLIHWRRTGKLGPLPWTVSELLAVKNRADAPPRRRGLTAAHGTIPRVTARIDHGLPLRLSLAINARYV
jgi:hypothetical protein